MKIYHNTSCSKSNAALDLLQQNGITPEVVEYLHNTPTKEELTAILAMLNLKPLQLIRMNEQLFQEKFANMNLSDEEWIDVMLQYPILIERPIIVKDGKAVIGRPVEKVLNLLKLNI